MPKDIVLISPRKYCSMYVIQVLRRVASRVCYGVACRLYSHHNFKDKFATDNTFYWIIILINQKLYHLKNQCPR